MALLNVENIGKNLPKVFSGKNFNEAQLKCMGIINELDSQISDNKQRYIHLEKEISVNKNKRIELDHLLRTHSINENKLKRFE